MVCEETVLVIHTVCYSGTVKPIPEKCGGVSQQTEQAEASKVFNNNTADHGDQCILSIEEGTSWHGWFSQLVAWFGPLLHRWEMTSGPLSVMCWVKSYYAYSIIPTYVCVSQTTPCMQRNLWPAWHTPTPCSWLCCAVRAPTQVLSWGSTCINHMMQCKGSLTVSVLEECMHVPWTVGFHSVSVNFIHASCCSVRPSQVQLGVSDR